MCSTPRYSARPQGIRKLPESKSYHQSLLQMMRSASQRYEQRQEELAKKQKKQ